MLGRYDSLIQVDYYPKGYTSGVANQKSGIMKLGNVTYTHIDHWTFKKEVRRFVPCKDKKGRSYLYIQLKDIDE